MKFAKYLRVLGMDDTAQKILNDQSILVEADFNPVKTWVEYINRLVGVAIGIFIILVAWRSIPFWKVKPVIFWLSATTLAGVIFQGWFGSIVVSTNLTTWTITVHMFLALVIVALLIHLYHHSDEGKGKQPAGDWGLKALLAACMVVLLVQIFLGTQVREAIDLAAATLPRAGWISEAGADFVIHRSFSWTVVILHLVLLAKSRKTLGINPLTLALIILILATLLTGAGMAYFAVPAYLQPVHLLIATVTFGVQYLLFLRLINNKEQQLVVT